MPRKAKPDDPDWIDLSANQKRQIKAAVLHLRKTQHLKGDWIPDGITPPEVQMEALRAYHRGEGPHINYVDSFIVKVANEAFRKARLRKVN
jgi:hypothetical protein